MAERPDRRFSAVFSRSAADWRVRLVAIACVLLVLVTVYANRDLLRRVVAENIGTELKHQVISAWSLLESRPRDTADFAPIAHADARPYGINVFFEQEVEEIKIRRSLDLIRAAGFGWIKQQVVWSEIESQSKGDYGPNDSNWVKYDRIVRLATEYGLDVVFRVDTSPVWARPAGKKDKLETPPSNVADYGDFLATIAARYRGQVKYYQIWNEPNLAFEWGNEYPSPAAYSRMLTTAYLRVKESDPESVVLMGALAPTLEMTERGLSDVYYLEALYEAGARDYFDVLSVNAYGLRHGPDDYRIEMDRDVNFSRPILIRETMVRNGDENKPIWAAEVGWCALPPDFGEEPRYGTVTREQQARYTERAFQRAQEEWPWLGGMALWHFRMINPRDDIQQHYYFNSVDEQFNPYPVYYALAGLATAEPIAGRGYHQESHWTVNRSDDWRIVNSEQASLGRFAQSDDAAGEFRFAFTGSDIDLVVPRGPEFGRLLVTVDGRADLANALSRSAGQAFINEESSVLEWQVRVPVARGLSDGRHEVVVKPMDSERHVGIDGFVVDGPSARDRLIRKLGVASAGASGIVLAVLIALAVASRFRRSRGAV